MVNKLVLTHTTNHTPMVARDNQKRDQAMLPLLSQTLLQIIEPQIIITRTQQMPSVRHADYTGDGTAALWEAQRADRLRKAFVETVLLDGAVAPTGVDVVPVGAPCRAGTPGGDALLGIGKSTGGRGTPVPDPYGAVNGGG